MSKELQVVNNFLSPGQDLSAYITTVNAIPLLTLEEEQDLAHKLFYQQDVNAASRLVLAHLRFVVSLARNYRGYGLSEADIIQEGNLGLMKAVKRFDPNVGVRLVSFAIHWIKAEIHEFVLRNWRIVKIATTKAQRKLFFNLRSQKKGIEWLNQAEVDQIAENLNVKADTVKEMEMRMAFPDASFSREDSDDENSYAPEDYLGDEKSDPLYQLEAESWETSTNENLTQALTKLDSRSLDIIKRRWLSEKKPTLHDLAAEYKVSAERIRQIEKSAMEKLKQHLLVSQQV